MSEPTHAVLVDFARRWLYGTRKCSVVATERNCRRAEEAPDAIGWRPDGESILVECKTSVADYLADQRKPHRARAGMGRERWYLTTAGLLAGRDLPTGWGWLELRSGRVFRRVDAVDRGVVAEVLAAEAPLLVALTRNVVNGWSGPGVTARPADEDVEERPAC